MDIERLTWRLKLDEGFAPKAKWDSAKGSTQGQWTNGYGTKAKYPYEEITQDAAHERLVNVIDGCVRTFYRIYRNKLLRINGVRAEALTNMFFNLGCSGVLSFRKMNYELSCVPIDWTKVGDQAEDSRWRGQVGRRAARIIQELRTGEYFFTKKEMLRIKV